jgi:hypothetical protein
VFPLVQAIGVGPVDVDASDAVARGEDIREPWCLPRPQSLPVHMTAGQFVCRGECAGESSLCHPSASWRLDKAWRRLHPIAAENRLEGWDCRGWRLRHRLGHVTVGSALDQPALEGHNPGG